MISVQIKKVWNAMKIIQAWTASGMDCIDDKCRIEHHNRVSEVTFKV